MAPSKAIAADAGVEARNALGEVRACDCGGVHLAMGPLTVHFADAEVGLLLQLCTAAQQMVRPAPRDLPEKKRRGPRVKNHSMLH
ncbi:MAG: hypothetical protein EOO40_12180 [Deltaproteobacteria bacterium]|nr:MAG: hypothetical protein EOO40_12180 [Deltaproteobacteria bacterium]